MSATPCEACHGYRLKPEALAVKIDGQHIGEVSLLSVKAAIAWARDLPQKLDAKQNEIAAAHPEGDPRAPDLPQRRRPRLSHAGARLRHAVGRREPAHPARLADRLRASPACSMCSTSRRSACISATMRACSRRCGACATSATP